MKKKKITQVFERAKKTSTICLYIQVANIITHNKELMSC